MGGWLSGRYCEFQVSSSTAAFLLELDRSPSGYRSKLSAPWRAQPKTLEYLSERGLCLQKAKNSPLGTATLLSKPAERR